jgi:putative glutamine amidotransferase
MPRPIIGINTSIRQRPDPDRAMECYLLTRYIDAVAAAGGAPVLLPPPADPRRAADVLSAIDGLLLSGSDDLDPEAWGEALHPKAVLMHPRRNAADLALARAALRRRMPVLGICGGHQLINVALGGSLFQHLYDHFGEKAVHHGRIMDPRAHEVSIMPRTRLARIVRAKRIWVNSSHHQSVDRLGRGLRQSAICIADAVIEAIEHEDPGRFVLGIEWHPEAMTGQEAQMGLFRALVREAGKKK